jgi:hypothetical protein
MDDMAKKNAYTTLGLKSGADERDVTKAYRKLAMQYHPDRNPGDKAAEEKFMEITRAYEYLTKGANGEEFTGSGSIFEFIRREEKRRAAASEEKKPEGKADKGKDEFVEPEKEPESKSRDVAKSKSYRERLEENLETFRRVVGDIKPHIDTIKTQGGALLNEAAKTVGDSEAWRKRAGSVSDFLGSGEIERRAENAMDAIDQTLFHLGIPRGLKETGLRGKLSGAISDAVNGLSRTLDSQIQPPAPPTSPGPPEANPPEESPAKKRGGRKGPGKPPAP